MPALPDVSKTFVLSKINAFVASSTPRAGVKDPVQTRLGAPVSSPPTRSDKVPFNTLIAPRGSSTSSSKVTVTLAVSFAIKLDLSILIVPEGREVSINTSASNDKIPAATDVVAVFPVTADFKDPLSMLRPKTSKSELL